MTSHPSLAPVESNKQNTAIKHHQSLNDVDHLGESIKDTHEEVPYSVRLLPHSQCNGEEQT